MTGQMKPRAMAAVFLATLMFSTGGILVKLIPGSPLAISSLRSIIAIPILLATLRRPKFTWSLPQIGAAATRLTTAANAIVLQYGAPIYVAVTARSTVPRGRTRAASTQFGFIFVIRSRVWTRH